MTEEQRLTIIKIVNTFAQYIGINNENEINKTISKLTSMHISDAIDVILVMIGDNLDSGVISIEDVFNNKDLFLSLEPEKYKTMDDFVNRLRWIKAMNIEHTKMSLDENHKLVMEAFDRFNNLLQGRFDCYYTGGLMGYIATSHELDRYHGDLDLFINETQLFQLKELIDASEDFEFVSDINSKEVGHEFKIVYKGTDMSIGLFLFNRKEDNSITTKHYYYGDNSRLYVNEEHYTKRYTDLSFSNQVREHNGALYRMMSLESIYNSKKNSRPKDKRDAMIIKDNVDLLIDYYLDIEKVDNIKVRGKEADILMIEMFALLTSEERKTL